MSLKQKGFSLTEVLIAMVISSILLLGTSRFLPAMQKAVLSLSAKQALEEEVWLRLFAVGKQIQRAGFCAGNCQGQGLVIGRQGGCVIVQWDANGNGVWDATAAENDSMGFRLESGSLELQRGATSCEGKGWEKLTDPERLIVQTFVVSKRERIGFAPEFSIELSAIRKGERTTAYLAQHVVTGFNL